MNRLFKIIKIVGISILLILLLSFLPPVFWTIVILWFITGFFKKKKTETMEGVEIE